MPKQESEFAKRLDQRQPGAIREFFDRYGATARKVAQENFPEVDDDALDRFVSDILVRAIHILPRLKLAISERNVEMVLRIVAVDRTAQYDIFGRSLWRSVPYLDQILPEARREGFDFQRGVFIPSGRGREPYRAIRYLDTRKVRVTPKDLIGGVEATRVDHMVFEASEELTLGFLETRLLPYLHALAALQEVCNQVVHGKHFLPSGRIQYIISQSPVSVGLNGAGEAIHAVEELVTPWKREHAKTMADLDEKQREQEIKKAAAEAMLTRANAAKERAETKKIEAEAQKLIQEAEQLKVETEKAWIELNGAKLKLALEIVSSMSPDLPENEKMLRAGEMMKSLDVLATGPLQLKA